MNLKIDKKIEVISLLEIESGTIFKADDCYYLKTSTINCNDVTVVNLENGVCEQFPFWIEVIPVTAEVYIYE